MKKNIPISRRNFFRTSMSSLGLLAVGSLGSRSLHADYSASINGSVPAELDFESLMYPFELPPLPYEFSAMEPYIDQKTMEIHYRRHHAAYVRNLNQAIKEHPSTHHLNLGEMLSRPEELPEKIRTAVRNNGGGHLNHCLFWYTMVNPGSRPSGDLGRKINETFGDTSALLDELKASGATRFGSGWGWLCVDSDGELVVVSTPNQDATSRQGLFPLLGVDVWEHAYYLKYQNRRGDYLDAWAEVIDWDRVGERYGMARMLREKSRNLV